jgi:uncharacterized protein (DUF342 family)
MTEPIVTFTVDDKEGKVFATISSEGSMPNIEAIVEQLKNEGIPYWIDEKAISKALSKALVNEPFEIGYSKNGKVTITVPAGDKEAYMVLEPPYGGKELEFEDVAEILCDKSINYGIDIDAITQAINSHNWGNKILIAAAKKPVNGQNASIEYLFRTKFDHKPRDLDEKKIDYRDLESVTSVAKDTILARKTPATPGTDGISITGKPLKAFAGKDVRLSTGKNTHLSADGLELFSDIDGQPLLADKVSVEPIITIDGDIDYNTGNIDFQGSVKVLGSIISGFSLKATANIQIEGVVEDAYVEAGGDVLVKGGIRGRGNKTVKAGGMVSALFIEQASVEAKGNIFAKEILHSHLTSGDQVTAIKGKGLIFGGKIIATNLIHANTIGADSDIRTELVVGFDPHQKAELEAMKEQRKRHESTLTEIEIALSTLKRLKAQNSPLWQRHELDYDKLLEAHRQTTENLDRTIYDLGIMEDKLIRSEHAHIKVAKTIYPNVLIRIGYRRYQNETELVSTSFYEEDGEVKASVYVL